MPVRNPATPQLSSREAPVWLELADKAVAALSLEEWADQVLPVLTGMTGAAAALVYLEDPRFLTPFFRQTGLPAPVVPKVERFLAGQLQTPREDPEVGDNPISPEGRLTLIPLRTAKGPLAFLGIVGTNQSPAMAPLVLEEKILTLLGHTLERLLDRLDLEKRHRHLNAYLTVSSMIAQALDLRDVLEAVLYFCMEAVAAEAASVLLLDYEKQNFRFYSAEGPAKPVLLTATFAADQGLAGAVLRSQQAEIIHDVRHDPRFYGKFDTESGFQTRNMMVLPLTAGEEKIGVLEVLNQADGLSFRDDELLLLQSMAEEIAFAIRNAKLFEVVVKSYCKQRQGLNTCKGCKRPLGSWTPCVKYREASGVLE